VVWQPPQLIVIRQFPRTIDGVRYQLTGLMGPRDYAITGERLPASLVVERWTTAMPPPAALAILATVGLNGDGTLSDEQGP
jgi:hypothetical protein